ncbi:Csu type fimbrial protein [Luteimonas suaedae]|uniref:Csu type fimbrial protein n=1 Tax=Luteimonas suaedae TaxID=2605430 RepID=UPI0011EDDBC5|nr:spore coat U domain-containing protein [Luteimonas suaedae]
MNTLKSLVAVAAIACVGLSSAAYAQSASTTFDVTITIASACSIDTPAATDVDFGTNASTATNIDAAGQLNVNCTPGTDYDIALNEGLNAAGGGITARAMANGLTLVPYQLYQDAGRTVVWGDTLDTNTLAGTGTGAVQAFPVYGRVPSANFPAATYLDTVTATITY